MNDEFNKECAEAYGMHVCPDGQLTDVPIELYEKYNVTIFYVSDLHFHDSYDWAMLLVRKIKEDYIKVTHPADPAYRRLDDFYDKFDSILEFAESTPKEISQACLEVLK